MWTLGRRSKLYRAQPIRQGSTTGLTGAPALQVPALVKRLIGSALLGGYDVSVFSRAQLNFKRRPKERRVSPICMTMPCSVAVVFLHLPLLAAGRVPRSYNREVQGSTFRRLGSVAVASGLTSFTVF